MPCRIDIYIGSDNDSRKIHDGYLDRIKKWANETFSDGYTLVRGEGNYQGVSEDSVLLYVLTDYDVALRNRLEGLKRELKQESILVVKSAVDFELIYNVVTRHLCKTYRAERQSHHPHGWAPEQGTPNRQAPGGRGGAPLPSDTS